MANHVQSRFFHIDFLRAIAILGVMITHSLALFLGTPIINLTWNYLHFVVVGFVFCSGYVMESSFERAGADSHLSKWYKKRFLRLYLPFAVYVIVFMLIKGINSPRFLLSSLSFVGGVDVGWLTLLFLQLSLLTPLYIHILKSDKVTKVFIVVLVIFSIISLFYRIPSSYSLITAWLPWSLIFILGSLLAKYKKLRDIPVRFYLLTGLAAFAGWIILNQTLINLREPLTLTLHKYPPDIYYFLYGITINSWLLADIRYRKNLAKIIVKPMTFLSKHSYNLFFINLIVLNFLFRLWKHSSPVLFTVVSLGITLAFMYLATLVAGKLKVFSRKKSR